MRRFETRQQRFLSSECSRKQPFSGLVPKWGAAKHPYPPIRIIGSPFDEALRFELIHQTTRIRFVDADDFGKAALIDLGMVVDHGQHRPTATPAYPHLPMLPQQWRWKSSSTDGSGRPERDDKDEWPAPLCCGKAGSSESIALVFIIIVTIPIVIICQDRMRALKRSKRRRDRSRHDCMSGCRVRAVSTAEWPLHHAGSFMRIPDARYLNYALDKCHASADFARSKSRELFG